MPCWRLSPSMKVASPLGQGGTSGGFRVHPLLSGSPRHLVVFAFFEDEDDNEGEFSESNP